MNVSTEAPCRTQHAQFLHRVLHLLKMISIELEFEMTDKQLRPERVKKLGQYKRNQIDWMLRDMITSTDNPAYSNMVLEELDSERAKDLALWMDFALGCNNIGEILEELKQLPVKEAE